MVTALLVIELAAQAAVVVNERAGRHQDAVEDVLQARLRVEAHIKEDACSTGKIQRIHIYDGGM